MEKVAPPTKALERLAKVTPETTEKDADYLKIVDSIREKDNERELCFVCAGKEEAKLRNSKYPLDEVCVFYKHEERLHAAAKQEMDFPKKDYMNKKEQGARLACYKLWTKLEVGRLGRNRRKPLPICVEARIKLMKPSQTFTGYKDTERRCKKHYLQVPSEESDNDTDPWSGTLQRSPGGTFRLVKPKKKTKV